MFKFLNLGAHDELPMIQHALDTGINRLLERHILGLQVDELHGSWLEFDSYSGWAFGPAD